MKPTSQYYAVIFSSRQRDLSEDALAAYIQTATRMFELAAQMPGYLGVETVHQKDGTGITISYWESEEAIKHWRDQAEHAQARRRGKEEWYKDYTIRLAKVERSYEWSFTDK